MRIEDWYLLNQILTRQPPFDPLPNSLHPLSFGHLALHHLFLVHLWQICIRACVFLAESGWKREGSLRTMACILSSFRLPCTCFPLKSPDLLYTVMSDFHKQVLLQAKSCCVFERGGYCQNWTLFFLKMEGLVWIGPFVFYTTDFGCTLYVNISTPVPQANRHILFTLSTRSEYWCMTSDDCMPLLHASVALSRWEPVIWRQNMRGLWQRRVL